MKKSVVTIILIVSIVVSLFAVVNLINKDIPDISLSPATPVVFSGLPTTSNTFFPFVSS